MSTCRTTLHAEFPDVPFAAVLAKNTHGLLNVVERHFGMSIGQTVLQHSIDDALLVVPCSGQMSFVVVPYAAVTATWDGENSKSTRMLGQIDRDVRVLCMLVVGAEVFFGFGVTIVSGCPIGPEFYDEVWLIGLGMESKSHANRDGNG